MSLLVIVSLSSMSLMSSMVLGSKPAKWEESSQGGECPVGGVAQVVSHGVIVVVGHQEEGQEEEVDKQGEVESEREKLKDNRTSWMVWRWGE